MFESGFEISGVSSGIVIEGGQQTCPNCGAMARILDGEWGDAGGAMRLLRGPEWSIRRLADFQQRLRDAKSAAEAWRIVEQEAPELAREVKRQRPKMSGGDVAAWISAIFAALMYVQSMMQGQPATPEQIRRVVHEVVSSYDQDDQDHQDDEAPAEEDPKVERPTDGPSTTPPSSTPPSPDAEEPPPAPGHELPPTT